VLLVPYYGLIVSSFSVVPTVLCGIGGTVLFVSIIFARIVVFSTIEVIFIVAGNEVIDITTEKLVDGVDTKEDNDDTVDKALDSKGFVVLANDFKICVVLFSNDNKAKGYFAGSGRLSSNYYKSFSECPLLLAKSPK